MTKFEAKTYIHYVKVLLAIHKLNESVLDEALSMAEEALTEEDVPETFCQYFCQSNL